MSLLTSCGSHDLSLSALCVSTEDHRAGGEAVQPEGAGGGTAS